MKIIIAGSRTFNDFPIMRDVVYAELEKAPIDLIISGGAKGADTLAIYLANILKIPVKVMKADWDTHGLPAGVIRNREMAKEGDRLIAFWDGVSKGTKNMIEEMERLKKPVQIVKGVY